MPLRVHLGLLVFTALVGPVVAIDPIDRRSRDEPEVAPRAGDGRSGTCDVLRFDPKGDTLLAAGDDKVVTGWRHTDKGLDADPTRTEVLRWPGWREQRGGIKAMDVSADGTRVLVGGFGLRSSQVAILNRDRGGKLLLTWPYSRPGVADDNFRTVEAVAFNPAGTLAAFGTHDGSVWVWKPELRKEKEADAVGRWATLPRWVGHRPATKDGGADFARLLFFRDNGTKLVAVSRLGAVTEYDVSAPDQLPTEQRKATTAPAKPVFNVNDGVKSSHPVFQAVYDRPRDRLVVASFGVNRVLVRPLDGQNPVELPLPKEHFARTVAVHPKTGAVAVAVGTVVMAKGTNPQFHNDADDVIRVYDKLVAGGPPDRTLKMTGQGEGLAFHPTLDRLVVAGGDASEVTLYDLTKPDKPLTVVRGAGRTAWELALATDGTALGMRIRRDPAADLPNGRGAGGWTWMDLTTLTPAAAAPKAWAAAVGTADGWTVEPDKADRDQWYAVRGGVRVKLAHDVNQFNKPTCYTFLKAKGGGPTRLIVGHYYGASMYELPAADPPQTLPPARLYVGHAGEVLSVAAVDDAKGGWFVTGGSDHTVAAFHLAGWPSHAGLGVAFEKVAVGGQTRLRVKAVDVGSPGWEGGLQVGDELRMLAAGPVVYDIRPAGGAAAAAEANPFDTESRRPNQPLQDKPDAALAVLKKATPGQELYFRLASATGQQRDALTSVRQRPLWKLYQTFVKNPKAGEDDLPDEWVAWMWKGSYYQTDSPTADELVGWQVNGPTGADAPRFHKLRDLRGYQKNELVRTLVRDRDLGAALRQVRGPAPPPAPPRTVGAAEPAPIVLALDRLEVTDRPVTVNVRVDRRGSDVDLLPVRVELWLNDHRVKAWDTDPTKPFASEPVELTPDQFRCEDKKLVPYGDNVVTVLTLNKEGGRAAVSQAVTNRNKPADSTLIGLAVGVNDYRAQRSAGAARGGLGDLRYAVPDAQGVAARFAAHVGGRWHFPAGGLGLMQDATVTRQALLDGLTALRKTARPNDVLVLFLAGHGQLIGEKNGKTEVIDDAVKDPEKEFEKVRFAFCCPGVDPKKPGDEFVTADQLFDALAGLNCRKVLLLDVCRSGWATRTDVIRRFVPNGHGPMVMAACGPGQRSFESAELKHGLFTAAVLEAITLSPGENAAFDRADADQDGKLSCRELFDYVSQRVREERRDQTPVCFPERSRLPQSVVVAAPCTGR
jgi:hypothetical protein